MKPVEFSDAMVALFVVDLKLVIVSLQERLVLGEQDLCELLLFNRRRCALDLSSPFRGHVLVCLLYYRL